MRWAKLFNREPMPSNKLMLLWNCDVELQIWTVNNRQDSGNKWEYNVSVRYHFHYTRHLVISRGKFRNCAVLSGHSEVSRHDTPKLTTSSTEMQNSKYHEKGKGCYYTPYKVGVETIQWLFGLVIILQCYLKLKPAQCAIRLLLGWGTYHYSCINDLCLTR